VLVAQKRVLRKYFVQDKLTVKNIYKIIREERPDIVHHNNDVIANSADIRAASRAHVVSIIHNRSMPRYQKNLAGYVLDFVFARKASYRLNITEAVRKHNDRLYHLSAKKSTTVNDFIDISKYEHLPQKKDVRKRLRISDGSFVITNVGRIINWKGQHVLIEAIELIKSKLDEFKILLVGSTEIGIGSKEYDLQLKKLVCKYELQNHVLFTGHRDDVASIMQASDLIVHTAVHPEPQGLVIIEALLCNKPVIASNDGGAAELVNKYGGLLVEPGNAKALADVVLQLYESHKTGLTVGYTIRWQQLLEDFNAEKQAKEILNIYRKIHGEFT
jgi:glycosyltransferase involved in cell wall biosynthesis